MRRYLVAGEIAAGRNPADKLRAMLEQPTRRSFREWAEAYRMSRIDLSAETTRGVASHLKAMTTFENRDPVTITPADVQEWVAGLELKPSTTRLYISTLRAVLDFAGVDPNPARDGRVRLPRQERVLVDPPTASDVE